MDDQADATPGDDFARHPGRFVWAKIVEVSGQHKNRVIKVDGVAIDLHAGTGGVTPADLRWLP